MINIEKVKKAITLRNELKRAKKFQSENFTPEDYFKDLETRYNTVREDLTQVELFLFIDNIDISLELVK